MSARAGEADAQRGADRRARRDGLSLRPNVGAEEPGGPRFAAARSVARLWRLLFPASAQWPDPEPVIWPEAWGPLPSEAVFPWLPDAGLCAWWNDEASAAAAQSAGVPLFGPPAEVVARVHDKAFAARFAAEAGWMPPPFADCLRIFEPEELRDTAAFRELLRRELARWPDGWAGSATLKPRIGTSGRGRVRAGPGDPPDWEGALPRLAARGGAVLEPWVARERDYSVQLHVARDGAITLLGSLEQVATPSGVVRGHRGELDHRGRVAGPAEVEEELLAAACELARAAHAEGFSGPCGVDAFSFRHRGSSALRPAVELNARFTTGTVAIGLLRRARTWLDERLPPAPGARRLFAFDLGDPSAGEAPTRCAIAVGGARLHFADPPGAVAAPDPEARGGRPSSRARGTARE